MYNWYTDTSNWNRKSPTFQIWKLEQLINFGLNGERLDFKLTRKYWPKLNLDPYRKKFMELLLWPKQF